MLDDVDAGDAPHIKRKKRRSSLSTPSSTNGPPALSPLPVSKGGGADAYSSPIAPTMVAAVNPLLAAAPTSTATTREPLYASGSDDDDAQTAAAPAPTSSEPLYAADSDDEGTLHGVQPAAAPALSEPLYATDSDEETLVHVQPAAGATNDGKEEDSYMLPVISPDYASPDAIDILVAPPPTPSRKIYDCNEASSSTSGASSIKLNNADLEGESTSDGNCTVGATSVPEVAAAAAAAAAVASPADAARTLFSSSSPEEGTLLSAATVSDLLSKSGLNNEALHGIWSKVKAGSTENKGKLTKAEFVKAYTLVIDAGGKFETVAPPAGAATPTPLLSEDVEKAARTLFKTGNPGSKLDVIKGSVASNLLFKSGLAKPALKDIWNKAKRGSSAANSAVMNEAEFVIAYQMALAAGGNFEEKSGAAEETPHKPTPPNSQPPKASPTSEAAESENVLLPLPAAGEIDGGGIETAGGKRRGSGFSLSGLFGGGGGPKNTKKKTGIKKRNKRASSQKGLTLDGGDGDDDDDGNDAETTKETSFGGGKAGKGKGGKGKRGKGKGAPLSI